MMTEYPRTLAVLDQCCPGQAFQPGPDLAHWLTRHLDAYQLPAFLPELARLEHMVAEMAGRPPVPPPVPARRMINPSLRLAGFGWQNLVQILACQATEVRPGEQMVLIWQRADGAVRFKNAEAQDLLALKLIAEEIDLARAAADHQVTLAHLDGILARAVAEELVLAPQTLLRRDPAIFQENECVSGRYLATSAFTLQWHITQVCDLHCKHCYDRTSRTAVEFDRALAILDDFRDFCQAHHVDGQVTFTGGNPLLYRRFSALYQAASERGFQLAILGNPTSREVLEELQAIQPLEFYQVSLEGLADHNDHIRGAGHFQRIIGFLDLLGELGIYSMVMLTLTRANQEQVLPLAETLRGRVDLFNFNRLAMVGEGAQLLSAATEGYEDFLDRYHQAALANPCMGLKDNHFNALFARQGRPAFGGCTGHGCGAAFNFLSLLAEGEVHACRKFPSYLGNICEQSLTEIYHAEAARRYRAGSTACNGCRIRGVCGGCMAVTHGMGLDCLTARDPYCFFS